MADKSWKAFERRVAAFLGGQRNQMSGSVDQLTRGDVVHDYFYVECRERATLATVGWMKEAQERAETEDKVPLLALHRKYDNERYYLFSERDAEAVAIGLLSQFGWEFK